jgi:hypothetical protein
MASIDIIILQFTHAPSLISSDHIVLHMGRTAVQPNVSCAEVFFRRDSASWEMQTDD